MIHPHMIVIAAGNAGTMTAVTASKSTVLAASWIIAIGLAWATVACHRAVRKGQSDYDMFAKRLVAASGQATPAAWLSARRALSANQSPYPPAVALREAVACPAIVEHAEHHADRIVDEAFRSLDRWFALFTALPVVGIALNALVIGHVLRDGRERDPQHLFNGLAGSLLVFGAILTCYAFVRVLHACFHPSKRLRGATLTALTTGAQCARRAARAQHSSSSPHAPNAVEGRAPTPPVRCEPRVKQPAEAAMETPR